MYFLIRWLANAVGFFAAINLVGGIIPTSSDPWGIIAISLVAGLANSVLTPILRFFTLPIVVLTLGVWIFVLNVIIFWLVGFIGREFGFGFTLDGIVPALLGSIVVSIVSTIMGYMFTKPRG